MIKEFRDLPTKEEVTDDERRHQELLAVLERR